MIRLAQILGVGLILIGVGVLPILVPAGAQAASQSQPQTHPVPVRVLVVDETTTLLESLAVNALVGVARQNASLEIDAVIVSVDSSFDAPLVENPTGKRYDLVIVVPKDVTTLRQLWLVTRPYPQNEPAVWEAVQFIRGIVAEFSAQFGFSIQALDVNQDLIPGLFATMFQMLGVL